MVKSKIVSQFKYPSNLFITIPYRLRFFPILKNRSLKVTDRSFVYSYIQKKIKFYSTRYKVGCFATGRNRGVLTSFHMSRLTFKKYAIEGQISGVYKSRW
jgi:ribosomal protein S14